MRDRGPVCESRVVSVAEMNDWLRGARIGDRFIYCSGRSFVRGPTSERARQLYEARLVDLHQRRREDGAGLDYLIIKREAAPPSPSATAGRGRSAARGEGGEADAATEALLKILARHANFAKRCPSNPELARMTGLATTGQLAWRFRKLIEAGRIKSDTIETGPEAGWRVVTIVATGKRTLGPPSLAALNKSVADVVAEDGAA